MPDLDVKKLNELPTASTIADTDVMLLADASTGAMKQVSRAILGNYFATNAYVDNAVTGLLDDRGNFDADNGEFPVDGGSGSGGNVNKGDVYFSISNGTIDGMEIQTGDSIRALTDNPGQVAANWAIMKHGMVSNASLKGKWFIGMVNQNSGAAPTITVLQNDFVGYVPVKTRLSDGEYSISLPDINVAKQFVSFTFTQYDSSVNYQRSYIEDVSGGGRNLRISVGGGPFGGASWLSDCPLMIGDFS